MFCSEGGDKSFAGLVISPVSGCVQVVSRRCCARSANQWASTISCDENGFGFAGRLMLIEKRLLEGREGVGVFGWQKTEGAIDMPRQTV